MAITRKFLAALGIEADKIDEIITAHLTTVNELKEDRDKYKADAEKLPGVQQELDTAKADGEYKSKYDTLKAEYDQYKANVEAEKANDAKRGQYRKLLAECGIPERRLDAVLRLIDFDKVDVDKDGNISKVDDVKAAIKTDWADYIPEDKNRGADTPKPPANGNEGNHSPSRAAKVAQRHYEAIYGKKEGVK